MKTYLIDLDGTMYRGNDQIQGAIDFIEYCQDKQIPFYFLTNNATRTRNENAEHMLALGFKNIVPEQFYTSGMAAISYVSELNQKAHAYYLGEAGLKEAFDGSNLIYDEVHPEYVLVGMDKMGNYDKYSQLLHLLLNGATLVATNDDRRLPYGNSFKIGNGAIIAMLEYASNQTAIKIGKPHLPIIEAALSYFGLLSKDVCLIGDNLETDIQLGIKANIETIFVDSGVHSFMDIERLNINPTYQVHSLIELID